MKNNLSHIRILISKILPALFGLSLIFLISFAFTQKEDPALIRLQMYKTYEKNTPQDHLVAIKWCMAYLGSTITSDTSLKGIMVEDSVIILDIEKLGFQPKTVDYLNSLHQKWKKKEAYKVKNAIDLGRYISLTLGYATNYFELVDIPKKLKKYESKFTFDPNEGLVDNSSVSLVRRTISFSNNHMQNRDFFLATETDSVYHKVLELETLEVMENGMPKFGIYSRTGKRKNAGTLAFSNAGKPAKCLWCHESQILPMFRKQRDWEGFLKYEELQDSLKMRVARQRAHQDTLWKDRHFLKRWHHEKVEIAYISFMEPSAERLAQEWQMPLKEVKVALRGLETHRHHEFDFLGDLYLRKDVDRVGPWKVVKAPVSVREPSK